ncbi:hypothetical protein VNO77_05594 [Canavalia gladiata]|uniref:Transmembrane protein n=1 Tax=Canavalia gladiata TaxID=3824 RepID=A0AAN9MYN4_CANGL
MDQRSVKDEDAEVDLESGLLAVTEDYSKNASKQGKTLFAKVSCGLVGDSIEGEDRHSVYCDESNLTLVSMDMVKVTNTLLMGQECAENNTPLKEKRKKFSNKKAPKPPRPPRAPSLDAADHKLIREIAGLAMLKRARIERMKALKKMKATKATSSSSSSMFAMVFTVVFCVVIIFQGMSSGKGSVASFQGSPVPAGGAEGGLIDVQHQLNPSSSDPNAPSLEPHKIVRQVSGLGIKLRRDEATACCIAYTGSNSELEEILLLKLHDHLFPHSISFHPSKQCINFHFKIGVALASFGCDATMPVWTLPTIVHVKE